jgi:hypothetical protein
MKGQHKYLLEEFQEATPMGIASETCIHVSGVAV